MLDSRVAVFAPHVKKTHLAEYILRVLARARGKGKSVISRGFDEGGLEEAGLWLLSGPRQQRAVAVFTSFTQLRLAQRLVRTYGPRISAILFTGVPPGGVSVMDCYLASNPEVAETILLANLT